MLLVTEFKPHIGYARSAEITQKAFRNSPSRREACLALGYLGPEKFDKIFNPEKTV